MPVPAAPGSTSGSSTKSETIGNGGGSGASPNGGRPPGTTPSTGAAGTTSGTSASNADADLSNIDAENTLSFSKFNRSAPSDGKSYLSYPQGLASDGNTDYVRFVFKQYEPPFKKSAPRGNVSGYNASITSLVDDPSLTPIALYMPEDIQAQYGAQWGGKSIQNITGSILQSGASLVNGDLGAFGKNFSDKAGALAESGLIALISKGLEGLQKTGQGEGLTTNDVFSTTAGVVINPNSELLFQGFDLRTFNLSFKLVAATDKEAETIRDIIATFKQAMLPKLQTGKYYKDENQNTTFTDSQNFIGVPSLVQVQFMQGPQENPWVTQFKPCAITSLNVNYTPDGAYATYYTGAPVSITMDIGFAETKLVYREDIFKGGQSF